MDDSKGFSYRYVGPSAEFSVVLDDDGRVGYAYLLDSNDRICADVWLYNRVQNPIEPEWKDPEKAPYANPASFAKDEQLFPLPEKQDDVLIEWGLRSARILIKGKVIGMLRDGAKPGWAIQAARDGPLAKVLSSDAE